MGSRLRQVQQKGGGKLLTPKDITPKSKIIVPGQEEIPDGVYYEGEVLTTIQWLGNKYKIMVSDDMKSKECIAKQVTHSLNSVFANLALPDQCSLVVNDDMFEQIEHPRMVYVMRDGSKVVWVGPMNSWGFMYPSAD